MSRVTRTTGRVLRRAVRLIARVLRRATARPSRPVQGGLYYNRSTPAVADRRIDDRAAIEVMTRLVCAEHHERQAVNA